MNRYGTFLTLLDLFQNHINFNLIFKLILLRGSENRKRDIVLENVLFTFIYFAL
jgi:hypothetical protein